MKYIKKCTNNSCQAYTMKDNCPKCGSEAIRPLPPKFSIDDKYVALKREAKEAGRVEAGLISTL